MMPGPLSVTVIRNRLAWLAGGGGLPLARSHLDGRNGRLGRCGGSRSAGLRTTRLAATLGQWLARWFAYTPHTNKIRGWDSSFPASVLWTMVPRFGRRRHPVEGPMPPGGPGRPGRLDHRRPVARPSWPRWTGAKRPAGYRRRPAPSPRASVILRAPRARRRPEPLVLSGGVCRLAHAVSSAISARAAP